MAGIEAFSQVQRLASLTRQLFPALHHAIAYGSAVRHQPGLYEQHSSIAAAKGPMVDLLFVVDDAKQWHAENLKRNPGHYSWLMRKAGPEMICDVAEHLGVGVHFNTLVKLDAKTVAKYGVVSLRDLQDDLSHWRHLYLAGRLHKPVSHLSDDGALPASLRAHQRRNMAAAVDVALLLLPERFTTEDLVSSVAGLSYLGDVRTTQGLAEDPQKVRRIVAGSWEELHRAIVKEALLDAGMHHSASPTQLQTPAAAADAATAGPAEWRQAKTGAAQRHLLEGLPRGLLVEVSRRLMGYPVPEEHLLPGSLTQRDVLNRARPLLNSDGEATPANSTISTSGEGDLRGASSASSSSGQALLHRVSDLAAGLGLCRPRGGKGFGCGSGSGSEDRVAQLVRASVSSLVRRSSICQAASGLLTAGGEKSYQYVRAKIEKAWAKRPVN